MKPVQANQIYANVIRDEEREYEMASGARRFCDDDAHVIAEVTARVKRRVDDLQATN